MGKQKIVKYENKWTGEFPVFENDFQGPKDIFKLYGKLGYNRLMKIAKGRNNVGRFYIYDSVAYTSKS